MSINICHLSEGIAGHDGQVLGVIKTLSDSGIEVLITNIKVNWRIRWMRGLLKLISRKLSKYPGSLSANLILKCYTFSSINEIDIIVSAGASLAPLNLALAKKHNIKNIHLSTPRDWSILDFTAYITTKRVSNSTNNLVPDIVPNIFDPKKCKEIGNLFIANNDLKMKAYSLLIIGGDGIGYTYERNEWLELIQNFTEFCKKNNTQPLFITSRRTPKSLEKHIKNNYDTSLSVLFHSEKKRGNFHHLLFIAQNIFVTEDSSTMLSEAISAGKKVISVFPSNIDSPKKYTDIISKYENLGFIVRCEIKRMKDFSFQGDINISSRVSNSLKKFQDSLIKQLGLVE
tara:strand:+ start:188 stop:1216 length:1029 start_codon:yes stop_codon:yes gene_type:complete